MAAEGKAIIFYRCNLFIYFYFVIIGIRPAMCKHHYEIWHA